MESASVRQGGKRKRIAIGIAIAVVALLTLATTTFAAGPHGFGDFGHGFGRPGGNNNGNGMRDFGPRAVVTGVNGTTITLGGLPQSIATVDTSKGVKLVAIQADGTTKDASIGDFKQGSLVEVGFAFSGRGGLGRGQGQPNVQVTELGLLPANQVTIEGLVLANTNGTLQIVGMGGLKVTINTSSSTTVTKGANNASVGDIKVGDRIGVQGTQNGDTVTAATIRVADPSARMQGNGNGPASANPAKGTGTAKPGA